MDNELLLAEGYSNRKTVKSGRAIENKLAESVSSRSRQGKDSQLKTRYCNVKTAKSYGPHTGVGSEKESHSRCAAVETKLLNTNI